MKILLDLDGVIADFTSGACHVHGRPTYAVTTWDWYKQWGYTSRDFWHPIESLGAGFYTNYVKPYPWMNELLSLVREHGEVTIVTANPLHPGLAASKVEWIKRYIGDGLPTITMTGAPGGSPKKQLLAHPDRVLIDDSNDNVAAFRAAGGQAITFPQAWNDLHRVTKHRVDYVRECLSVYQRDKAA